MKVLVLGATGHIGNAVVRELLKRDYEVTAAYRRQGPRPNLEGLPIHCWPGDQFAPGQLKEWVEGHDVVVDAAAPYPANLFDSAQYDAEERMCELLDAVLRRDCLFGYVSSFTTLKLPSEKMEDWGAGLAMRMHPYFALKQRTEDLVMAAARDGLRAVIVNPTMCLGPWDIHDRELCLIPRLLCGEVPGAVRQILNVLDVREVAQGLIGALEAGLYGQPMLLSGHNISAQNLFSWICELAGVELPPLTAPTSVTAFASLALEAVMGVANSNSPIKSLAPILMYQHEWMPPCAAFRELGISLRPLLETLQDSIEWYRVVEYC
jgi:dihydroflavonol-4-reductase